MVRRSTEALPERREQLSDFLRVCRARLRPEDVGVTAGTRRRTPGLRREEVASLAGVGVSWYTWLEQGREINVSDEVLDAISRALRLTEAERTHLHLLAGHNPPLAGSGADPVIEPDLIQMMDAWAPRPAILHDRYWNILAVNAGTNEIFGYDQDDRNCLISFFTNTRYRNVYQEWASAAPAVVAAFRADAAHFPDDPGFRRVVSELSTLSPEFAELWARHEVGPHSYAVKAVRHPDAGDLVFDKTTLVPAEHPDWRLVLYHPHPGTEDRLEALADVGRAVPPPER